MGIIRNRMVIVHHWNEKELNEIRDDAIKSFQDVVNVFGTRDYDVSKLMVSPIMQGYSNSTEYTFVIEGECSKLGWEESDLFQEVRKQWCEKWKNKVCNMLIVDFGEGDQIVSLEFKSDEG